ncbi:MAG: lipoyl synthase [Syntrophotaleaceae bacterium]
MSRPDKQTIKTQKPKWLRRRLPSGPEYEKIRRLLTGRHLITVCQQALCPNQFECFAEGTATFMILGDRCTRQCGFCAVGHGPQGPPDPTEPDRVAEAVELLDLDYAVVTSVTRDDLDDGGAALFAATIRAIHERRPQTLVEVLIPDLRGQWLALAAILEAGPQVLNHNLETVPRLYPRVRPQADYLRSLELLSRARELAPHLAIKSGLMLGLGESLEELKQVWLDLKEAGCDILTMGQYLQPTAEHLEVERFVPPEEFEELRLQALAAGFAAVAAGPFVRSSYQAERLYRSVSRSWNRG